MKLSASLLLVSLLVIGLFGCDSTPPSETPVPTKTSQTDLDSTLETQLTPVSTIEEAFRNNQSNLQGLVRGTVVRFLADDVEGDRHQRLIVKLSNNQTLLVAHNIDLATRVPEAALGGTVYVHGEYEWNDEGGVVHWTHRDPAGKHTDGWIQFQSVRYE